VGPQYLGTIETDESHRLARYGGRSKDFAWEGDVLTMGGSSQNSTPPN
jgi:hypothetical protein